MAAMTTKARQPGDEGATPATAVLVTAVLVTAVLAATASTATARTLTVGRDAADLDAALAAAVDGDVVALAGYRHRGVVVLDKAVTLRGPGLIDGGGGGHVVNIAAAGARHEGVRVEGSGTDLQRSDACVYLGADATGAAVVGVHAERCTFGIYVHETEGVRIADCVVIGSDAGQRSQRGNGIHLFDATRAVVSGNTIRGGRDGIYVSATEHSLIANNRISHTRFGVHYMFSLHNRLQANVASDNVTGFAIMQSGHIEVLRNVAERNSDHGILFRDATDSRIEANRSERNGEGLFFFSSVDNVIARNVVLHNGVGAKVWAGSDRNDVRDNVFIGNRRQIFYVASRDLVWGHGGRGNLWGDYLGWDQDGDGVGDRPYRVDSFVAHLLYRYPQAALLVRSPGLELLALLAERMPLWRVPTVIDNHPLTRPPTLAQLAGADAAASIAAAATGSAKEAR
jgi:nitrous oxidase accessory protein